MDSDKSNEGVGMAPASPIRQTVPNGRLGSSERFPPAPLLENDRRTGATLTSARFDANEIGHMSAPQPNDVHAVVEAAAGRYTILNGDPSSVTQNNAGDEFARSCGHVTFLSEIPASDIGREYLEGLFGCNLARPTSTYTSILRNQRHLPAEVRVNGYAIGAVHDLANPASIDPSTSGCPAQSPVEVLVNGHGIRAVGTPNLEVERGSNELLAGIQWSPLATDALNAAMLEELPSPLSFYGRQGSPDSSHGAQDMAAAAGLLQSSAVEIPDRAAYALEQQTSRERAEEYVGEDPEDSTEFWQVAYYEDFGQNDNHSTFLNQIPVNWEATDRAEVFSQYSQFSLDQLPTSVDASPSCGRAQSPIAVDGKLLTAALVEAFCSIGEQGFMELRQKMEQTADALLFMDAINDVALEELRSALSNHGRQTVPGTPQRGNVVESEHLREFAAPTVGQIIARAPSVVSVDATSLPAECIAPRLY
ncbi:hypothetical protein PCL_11310 [Purpureocillium lilacinum]|uniref:Uncharacterized protein n=1 Tax=Purpureocillium lilacinum TaxID=33203 RepID=A0A2U3DPU3_PURLI|nr:hypothetical protein PCL_11310 [Purpureocillium lilacinum]